MNCFLEIVNQPFKHCGGGGSLWIFCSSHSAHGLRIHMSRSTFCLKPWLLLKIIWQGRLHPDGVEGGRLWKQWQVQWVLEPSPCWCDSDPWEAPQAEDVEQLLSQLGQSPFPSTQACEHSLVLLLSERLFPRCTSAPSSCRNEIKCETYLSVLRV